MDSDSSSLSDPPLTEDESLSEPSKPTLKLLNGKLASFMRKNVSPLSSPEPDQADLGREPSPPHEYTLADNPDISIIVMFRSRFDGAFPKAVSHLGPQDIEAGLVSTEPSEGIENLLCALLGLVLNRKKNPERGHYGRALEECLSSQRSQWPRSWAGKNPIAGGRTFQAMSPSEKLDLLRTLVHWSLSTSEAINNIIKDSYKQARKDDDINQPLSVQPWGEDTRKRRFYLVEGQIDAPFRIYRANPRRAAESSWFSVAGTIEEAQKVARDLRAERAQAAHRLANRITSAVPMFEEREDKRKRREYRRAQKERFTRPEPGFSLYEGRTRGKRMRYTYDDEDVYGTDETQRSSRQSRTATPADGPTFTASGRQVRSAFGRSYGDRVTADGGYSTRASSHVGDGNESETSQVAEGEGGRVRRSRQLHSSVLHGAPRKTDYNSVDDLDEESDAAFSGNEWDGDDQDFEGKFDDDEEDAEDSSDRESDDSFGDEHRSLVVSLRCGPKLGQALHTNSQDTKPERVDLNALDVSQRTEDLADKTSTTISIDPANNTGMNGVGPGLPGPHNSSQQNKAEPTSPSQSQNHQSTSTTSHRYATPGLKTTDVTGPDSVSTTSKTLAQSLPMTQAAGVTMLSNSRAERDALNFLGDMTREPTEGSASIEAEKSLPQQSSSDMIGVANDSSGDAETLIRYRE